VAKILTVARGLPSLVYPAVELSRRLAVAGHDVTFAGRAAERRLVEDNGLAFMPLDPDTHDEFLAADAASPVIRRLLRVRDRRRAVVKALGIDGFAATVRRARPDLMLCNGEMHEHVIAASAAGLRVVLLNSFVSIWRRPGLSPPHHMACPGAGWKGTRSGAWLLWTNLRVVKWRKRLAERARRVGCDRAAVLYELARREHFDLRREADSSQWLIPFTYRRLPVLSLHALEFEFPHEPPSHVHYVGPMVLDSRSDTPPGAPDRVRLDALIQRRRRPEGAQKLIYAAFGSTLSTDSSLLQRLVRSVALRPDWDLVISLSRRAGETTLGALPANVHAFDWLPQPDVLRHADVAVTHGGVNTIDECVVAGVPVLVYCGGHTDMAGTTSRVVFHGIGIAGDARRDGPEEIAAHLDRLVENDAFRLRVADLQRQYRVYADDRVAERVIESLLAEAQPDIGPTTAVGMA
jgi:UDP:flavonoid glycosyltransferase YjiC (YdhE family)